LQEPESPPAEEPESPAEDELESPEAAPGIITT